MGSEYLNETQFNGLGKIKVHQLDKKFEHISIFNSENATHVNIVALNRQRKRNAINLKMWREIGEVFRELGSLGDGCRCILLIGIGGIFCAGIDIFDPNFGFMVNDEDSNIDVARKYLSFRPFIRSMQKAFSSLEECSVPVIAAVQGPCIGGGVDLICSADIRICAPSARFGVREVKLGLAADVGTLQRFPKVVGHSSMVRELCFTGDDFGAHEAANIGLVSRVAPTDNELLPLAINLCKKIAQNSPVAVASTKISLNFSRDHSVQEGLDHIASHNAAALMTNDVLISVQKSRKRSQSFDFQNIPAHGKL